MSELRIERSYPVSPERLFAFVTETKNLLLWWGPEGTSIGEEKLDLTRPGPWSLVLINPGGGRFAMRGTVRSVTPPRAVEFTMNVPGDDATDSTVRFEIEPDGKGGSRFALIQSGITDEMVEMGKHGWRSTLTRLEKLMGVANQAA
jgi:uncharacterized protein YndB with AHSA1/START domain